MSVIPFCIREVTKFAIGAGLREIATFPWLHEDYAMGFAVCHWENYESVHDRLSAAVDASGCLNMCHAGHQTGITSWKCMPVPFSTTDLARLEPATEDERRRRSMYLAAQSGRHSVLLIRKCLDHCDVIDFGGAGALKQRPEINEHQHHSSVKELTALALWLTLIEQIDTEDPPHWVQEMFVDGWGCVDILFPDADYPRSHSIMENYPGRLSLDDVYQTAAMRLSHALKVGDIISDATLYFEKSIRDASPDRSQIFKDTLNKTVDELVRLIDEPPPFLQTADANA